MVGEPESLLLRALDHSAGQQTPPAISLVQALPPSVSILTILSLYFSQAQLPQRTFSLKWQRETRPNFTSPSCSQPRAPPTCYLSGALCLPWKPPETLPSSSALLQLSETQRYLVLPEGEMVEYPNPITAWCVERETFLSTWNLKAYSLFFWYLVLIYETWLRGKAHSQFLSLFFPLSLPLLLKPG